MMEYLGLIYIVFSGLLTAGFLLKIGDDEGEGVHLFLLICGFLCGSVILPIITFVWAFDQKWLRFRWPGSK